MGAGQPEANQARGQPTSAYRSARLDFGRATALWTSRVRWRSLGGVATPARAGKNISVKDVVVVYAERSARGAQILDAAEAASVRDSLLQPASRRVSDRGRTSRRPKGGRVIFVAVSTEFTNTPLVDASPSARPPIPQPPEQTSAVADRLFDQAMDGFRTGEIRSLVGGSVQPTLRSPQEGTFERKAITPCDPTSNQAACSPTTRCRITPTSFVH